MKLPCVFFFLAFTSVLFSQEPSESCVILTTLENPNEIVDMNNARIMCDAGWLLNANVLSAEYVSCPEDGGASMITGTLVSTADPSSGWCMEFIFSESMTWEEWSNQTFLTSYIDDSNFAENHYLDWKYALLESGTLTGWGNWEGASMELIHSPVNNYYGFQLGVAANGLNQNVGAILWTVGDGTGFNEDTGMLEAISNCSQTFRFDFGECFEIDSGSCLIEEGSEDCLMNSTQELTSESIEVYPNPSTGAFTLSGLDPSQHTTIEIYNITGQLILSEAVHSETSLKLNNQKIVSGSYVIRIVGEREIVFKRVVID